MSKLHSCLEAFSNKDKRIYAENYENGKKIIEETNPWYTQQMVQELQNIIQQNPIKGQKEYSYKLLNTLVKQNTRQITPLLSTLIPMAAQDVNSSIKEVKDIALKTLKRLLNNSGNEDLTPFIPVVL